MNIPNSAPVARLRSATRAGFRADAFGIVVGVIVALTVVLEFSVNSQWGSEGSWVSILVWLYLAPILLVYGVRFLFDGGQLLRKSSKRLRRHSPGYVIVGMLVTFVLVAPSDSVRQWMFERRFALLDRSAVRSTLTDACVGGAALGADLETDRRPIRFKGTSTTDWKCDPVSRTGHFKAGTSSCFFCSVDWGFGQGTPDESFDTVLDLGDGWYYWTITQSF